MHPGAAGVADGDAGDVPQRCGHPADGRVGHHAAGVSYVARPPGPYSGTVDTTVTVRATLADGFAWGQMPDGWVPGATSSTALFTVDLVGTTCAAGHAGGPDGQAGRVRGRRPRRRTRSRRRSPTGSPTRLSPAGSPAGQYPASPAAVGDGHGQHWPQPVWPGRTHCPTGGRCVNATTATFTVDLPDGDVHAGAAGGADGDAGDVCRGCGHRSRRWCWRPPPSGVSYVAVPQGPYSGTVNTDGDGDGDAGGRVRLGSDARRVDAASTP